MVLDTETAHWLKGQIARYIGTTVLRKAMYCSIIASEMPEGSNSKNWLLDRLQMLIKDDFAAAAFSWAGYLKHSALKNEYQKNGIDIENCASWAIAKACAEKFDPGRAALKTWLHSIMMNKCRDEWRHQQVVWKAERNPECVRAVSGQRFASPIVSLAHAQFGDVVAMLPIKQQDIVLDVMQGDKYADIAKRYTLKIADVRRELKAAVKFLTKECAARGIDADYAEDLDDRSKPPKCKVIPFGDHDEAKPPPFVVDKDELKKEFGDFDETSDLEHELVKQLYKDERDILSREKEKPVYELPWRRVSCGKVSVRDISRRNIARCQLAA
jgi:DNA-directed RNA polymerase specialized sigma24 family protein